MNKRLICFLCDAEIAPHEARLGLQRRLLCPRCYSDYGNILPSPTRSRSAVPGRPLTCPTCGQHGDEDSFTLDLAEHGDRPIAACPKCGQRFEVRDDDGYEQA